MIERYDGLESNFPGKVDTFDRMQDLTVDTKPKADKYYSYINAGNLTMATQFLDENPELDLSVFNAKKYNRLLDSVIAVQRFFKDTIAEYLGDLADKESIDGGSY